VINSKVRQTNNLFPSKLNIKGRAEMRALLVYPQWSNLKARLCSQSKRHCRFNSSSLPVGSFKTRRSFSKRAPSLPEYPYAGGIVSC
jgi:hypothetical protein